MWVVSLRLKQDNCIIASRCKKFNVVSYSIPLGTWNKNGYCFTTHRHTIVGSKKSIDKYIKNLKKDEEIVKIEVSNNTILVEQKRKTEDLITSHYNPHMFLVKPVFSDKDGLKYCEFASWKKEILMDFVKKMKKANGKNLKLLKFKKVKLEKIYFPSVMPKLSDKQTEAFSLAIENGYYNSPRKINLQKLAKLMKISVPTFQEHLRKAEAKILPNTF